MSTPLDPLAGPTMAAEEITDQLREDELLEEDIRAWAERERRVAKMREEHFAKSRVKPHMRGGVPVAGYTRADQPAAIKPAVAGSHSPDKFVDVRTDSKRGTVSGMTQPGKPRAKPDLGEKIAAIAEKNHEGFTFHGGRVLEIGKDHGFVVAVKGSPSLALDKLDAGKISSWVAEHGQGKSVGGWKDNDANKYVLDIVEVHQDRATAIKLARERNEKAIFDIFEGKEIDTGGSGNY